MTKKVLIIGLNGVLLKPRPFEMGHQEWFRVMAELLHDHTIMQHAFKENYFQYVQEIMKRYLGDINEHSRIAFARNMYGMSIVEVARPWDVVEEFAELLRRLKKRYALVLITSTPAIAIEPLLEKTQCKDLFDLVIKGPLDTESHKKELFEAYLKKHGRPEFYIGKGNKDMEYCRSVGIKTITAEWLNPPIIQGNFSAKTPQDVEKILERYWVEG